MIEAAAALAAWLGASLVVLADGRRGLALGLVIAAAGIGVIVLQVAGPLAAVFLAVGGAVAAARRLDSGRGAWEIMPPGSTPRLVLCVAGGLVALWVALTLTSGGSPGLRFAVVVVIGLAAARVLSSEEPTALLTAVALSALGAGAAAALEGGQAALWAYGVAAVVAAGAGWFRLSSRRAA